MRLPDFLAPLFHNYIFEAIDGQKNYKFVIKTVLTYSDWEQIEWLFKKYGAERVGDVFKDNYYGLRTLPASRRLWEIAFIKNPDSAHNRPANHSRHPVAENLPCSTAAEAQHDFTAHNRIKNFYKKDHGPGIYTPLSG